MNLKFQKKYDIEIITKDDFITEIDGESEQTERANQSFNFSPKKNIYKRPNNSVQSD